MDGEAFFAAIGVGVIVILALLGLMGVIAAFVNAINKETP